MPSWVGEPDAKQFGYVLGRRRGRASNDKAGGKGSVSFVESVSLSVLGFAASRKIVAVGGEQHVVIPDEGRKCSRCSELHRSGVESREDFNRKRQCPNSAGGAHGGSSEESSRFELGVWRLCRGPFCLSLCLRVSRGRYGDCCDAAASGIHLTGNCKKVRQPFAPRTSQGRRKDMALRVDRQIMNLRQSRLIDDEGFPFG